MVYIYSARFINRHIGNGFQSGLYYTGIEIKWNLLWSYLAKEVCWCLMIVKPLVRSIKLILFDRGFYSEELMLTLSIAEHSYLIFVPKNSKVQKELAQMVQAEKKRLTTSLS